MKRDMESDGEGADARRQNMREAFNVRREKLPQYIELREQPLDQKPRAKTSLPETTTHGSDARAWAA